MPVCSPGSNAGRTHAGGDGEDGHGAEVGETSEPQRVRGEKIAQLGQKGRAGSLRAGEKQNRIRAEPQG